MLLGVEMKSIATILIFSSLLLGYILCARCQTDSTDPTLNPLVWPLSDWDLIPNATKCVETQQSTTIVEVFTQPPGPDYYPNYSSDKYTTREILKRERSFNPELPTYLIIHGYLRGCLRDLTWAMSLVTVLFRKQRCNVLYADWKHKSSRWNYWTALQAVPVAADELYTILLEYERAFPEFNKANVHIIGFSLGAQVAGMLGQLISGQVNQITALDPAGVSVSKDPQKVLSRDDAKYVIVYHTTSSLSTDKLLGDIDIFFEGGSDQPRCQSHTIVVQPICSHFSSTTYMTEYYGKCIVMGYTCSSFKEFLKGECGFCESDSTKCIGIGYQWQYDDDVDFRPNNINDAFKNHPVPWTYDGSKYFVKLGKKPPFCTYTYQLIVKFPDRMRAQLKYLKLRLEPNQKSGSSREVKVSHHFTKDTNLKVFSGSGEDFKLISGQHIYTAMLVIQSDSDLFDKMPIKFHRALIFEVNYGFFPGSELIDLNGAECYMNFMSHHEFKKRSAYSGPIELEFSKAKLVNGEKLLKNHRSEKAKRPEVVWNKKKKWREEEASMDSYLFTQPKESLNNIIRAMSG